MSEPVPSFLDLVRARRAEIDRQRAALDTEDQELAVAERVAERLEPFVRAGAPNAETGSTVTNAVLAAGAPKTQPELVISTLKASAGPWFESSNALHDEIQRIHGVDIKSGSLLPVLTNLKNEGIILREGPRIALAERVANNALRAARLATAAVRGEGGFQDTIRRTLRATAGQES